MAIAVLSTLVSVRKKEAAVGKRKKSGGRSGEGGEEGGLSVSTATRANPHLEAWSRTEHHITMPPTNS